MRNLILSVLMSALMTINVYAFSYTPCYTATTSAPDNACTYTFDTGSLSAETDDILILINGNFTTEKLNLHKFQNIDYIAIQDLLSLYSSSYIYNKKTNQLTFTINHHKFIVNTAENTVVITGTKNKSIEKVLIREGTLYLPFNFICENSGYDFGLYPFNENNSVTKNPVLWIEKDDILDISELNTENIRDSIQNYILANPDLFTQKNFMELYSNSAYYQPVSNPQQEFQYMGQLGRYCIFVGSHTILYDIDSGEIYQYSEAGNNSQIEYKGAESIDLFNYSEFLV